MLGCADRRKNLGAAVEYRLQHIIGMHLSGAGLLANVVDHADARRGVYDRIAFPKHHRRPHFLTASPQTRGRLFLFGQQLVQLVQKRVDVLELPVNRCETDVGHLVDVLEPLHHHLADAGGGNLGLQRILKLHLDGGHHRIHLAAGHKPLVAGADDAVEHLVAVEALAGFVLLHHRDRNRLDGLVGGEPLLTVQTFAAAPDGRTVRGRA